MIAVAQGRSTGSGPDLVGRARELEQLSTALEEGRNVVFMGAAYLGPVARYLGLLAMTTGESERALAHLETARSAAERMGARPTVVLTALDAAEVLARRGAAVDAQRGRALIERVAQDAAQQRMVGAQARIVELRDRFDALEGAAAARRAQLAALTRDQEVWFLEYGGRRVCLQDAKGLRHLATLLSQPDRRVAAVALAAAADDEATDPVGVPALTAGFRERAAELREELAEAQAFNDPQLGALLQSSVRTGALCSYEHDPSAPLDWDVQP